MIKFENLRIQRLIVHEVVKASALDEERQPIMSQALNRLDPVGLLLVAQRLAEALGTESHSIEVSIEDAGEGSAFWHATNLFEASDAEFVSVSQRLALKLSQAQTVGSIKSGIAVIIQATVGADASPRRLVVIVKAESDAAFVKRNLENGVSLEFVKEMVLGAQQKLFKIGAFLERAGVVGDGKNPDGFDVVVYDHQMNIKGEGTAAQYFYKTFLGATMLASTPQINKQFFDASCRFIQASRRTYEEKWALRGDLISYFRSAESSISGRGFADRYFTDAQERRTYLSHLRDAGVPQRAIQKDSRFFAHQLKQRRLSFSNRVYLNAPADGFERQVRVIDSTQDATTLRIAGRLIDES